MIWSTSPQASRSTVSSTSLMRYSAVAPIRPLMGGGGQLLSFLYTKLAPGRSSGSK